MFIYIYYFIEVFVFGISVERGIEWKYLVIWFFEFNFVGFEFSVERE